MKIELNPAHQQAFVKKLLKWNGTDNVRKMPWKGEKDPYKIWLSEVILQQTRVEQGLKYYENFIKSFPTVHQLAAAPVEKVFKHWEGLGYYSRCRNLIETANYISKELKGVFPSDYHSILKLKGVGDYTASAIASFAYNLPYAVLDGNVFRVLSRIFDEETPIDSTEGKKKFSQIAQNILPATKAGEYNQAIMDFGAIVCKPVPDCKACFFTNYCQAYQLNKQHLLPIKEKKIIIKKRWFNYVVVTYKKNIAIRQRTGKDIWQQLFEFILIETGKPYSEEKILKIFEERFMISKYEMIESYTEITQKLTHQTIHFNFIVIEINKKEKLEDFSWVSLSTLTQFAFPKTLKDFIQQQFE